MNLHGYLARERIHYGSAEGIDFTSVYFAAVLFHALSASNALAREKGQSFAGFERSKYADGTYFDRYGVARLAARDRPGGRALRRKPGSRCRRATTGPRCGSR